MTRGLLNHLMNRYRKITPTDLKDKKLQMNDPIDPSSPLEKHFESIKDCVQFTDDGNTPYTPKKILQTALLAILTTGIYGEAERLWQKKATAD